jgi:hypothetical protein
MSIQATTASNTQQTAQVQDTQNIPKTNKEGPKSGSEPQDSVNISSQGRAAQQASQSPKNGGKK